MEIEQHVWGMTPEGEAVIRYTMRNAVGSEIRLSTFGAAIVGISVPDRNGRVDDVVSGPSNFDDCLHDPSSSGKCAGRCVGGIAGGCMELDGQQYRLETYGSANPFHGGSHGFGNRLWEGRVETNRVVMSLLSPDGDEGYPGTLVVEAAFDFDDDNSLEITYFARTDRTTVVNLAHPMRFNLSGNNSNHISGCELRLRSQHLLEQDERQLPTGRLLKVTGTAHDYSVLRPLRNGIVSDDAPIRPSDAPVFFFPIDGWQRGILSEAGELRDPQSGRRVTVLTSQPCVALSAIGLPADGCSPSDAEVRTSAQAGIAFVCLHHPDAVHRPEFPSPLLHPNELYCQKSVYRFGTFPHP